MSNKDTPQEGKQQSNTGAKQPSKKAILQKHRIFGTQTTVSSIQL